MDELKGSEAVYGFCAWLTTREEVTEMGACKDSGAIADLMKVFCNTNNLSNPRENYSDFLAIPQNNDSKLLLKEIDKSTE